MSDGNNELAATGGSWWGSWINSAKEKTSTVLEAVKKDLDELSSAVRTEASHVGAAIENTLRFEEGTSPVGNVKKSISTFFGQVTEVLAPSVEDDETEVVLITRDGAITLTGFQKHLADIQSTDKTYLDEPVEELADKYKRWLEVVEQDQFTQNRLAKHLASSEILNEKYLTLVPEKITHMDFWKRYLFKRALLEDALANAEIAERRAKAEVNSTKPTSPLKATIQTEQPKLSCTEKEIAEDAVEAIKTDDENIEKELQKELDEEINWDSEEITCNIELSEEEQTRLLEEYEQEIQEREKRKSVILSEDTVMPTNPIEPTTPQKLPVKTTSPEKTTDKKITKQTPIDTKKNSKPQPKTIAQRNENKQKHSSKTKIQPQKNEKLILQKDHFNKEESSSTSDESWEKDFDINE